MSYSNNTFKGRSELPSDWGISFLNFWGWFIVIVSIILGIIFMTQSPITGIIVGLSGIIQGLMLLAIASYMEAQRRSLASLQRSLRGMDKELSKALKLLSGMDKELSKAFQSLSERLDS
tara:strand:- start:61 stop:417 length:357 start_codon:yes stop_codon:yes gene_type:complete